MPSAKPGPWPSEIRLNPEHNILTVAFDNGESFGLRAEYLRVESPSAEVRNHGGPKTIVMGKEQVKIASLEPVGNYAIRINWSDGHSTGIYSYDHLRRICPCEECRKLPGAKD